MSTVVSSAVTCFRCKQSGHYANRCPVEQDQSNNNNNNNSKVDTSSAVICFKCKELGHFANQCPNGNNNNSNDKKTKVSLNLDHITCYKCHEQGHYATKCPLLKQQKEQREQKEQNQSTDPADHQQTNGVKKRTNNSIMDKQLILSLDGWSTDRTRVHLHPNSDFYRLQQQLQDKVDEDPILDQSIKLSFVPSILIHDMSKQAPDDPTKKKANSKKQLKEDDALYKKLNGRALFVSSSSFKITNDVISLEVGCGKQLNLVNGPGILIVRNVVQWKAWLEDLIESCSNSKRSRSEESDGLCCICMSNKYNCLLMPCRHLCVCNQCVSDVASCPLCRKPIQEFQEIFMS